jgi:hypothetical protein
MKDVKEKGERIPLSDAELAEIAGGGDFNAVGLMKCIVQYFRDHPETKDLPDRKAIAYNYCISIGAANKEK